METNNKYYTPDITEFHIGFEFELKVIDWENKIFDNSNFYRSYDNVEGCILRNSIRVKYLDKEDIESMKFHSVNEYKFKSNGNRIITIELIENNKVFIEEIIPIDTIGHEESYTLFSGIIKNKSELKFILTRLRII